MKKNLILLGILALSALQCVSVTNRIDRYRAGANPYVEEPFYARYLNTGSRLDRDIRQTLQALAAEPSSPTLHNDLGMLLWEKGFPNDALREFRRAVAADSRFHPAWFNIGLVEQTRGNTMRAKSAFARTIELKPGDATTLFELGLMAERAGKDTVGVEMYSKAFRINPNLLDVRVNPRILDTKLIPRALIASYPRAHETESVRFHSTPTGYVPPTRMEAPSREAAPSEIVTPTPPATEQGSQTPPPPASPSIAPNPQTPEPTPKT
jgi:tetratricopeptide (TPR) repeat protein